MPEPVQSYENVGLLEEKILRRIPGEIIALSFVAAIAGFILFDALTALFILAGGILSAINFIWLKQFLSRFLILEKKRALKSTVFFYCLRLLLILAIFFIIIFFFSKKIIALVAGFSMIIPVFLVEALTALSSIKKWKS